MAPENPPIVRAEKFVMVALTQFESGEARGGQGRSGFCGRCAGTFLDQAREGEQVAIVIQTGAELFEEDGGYEPSVGRGGAPGIIVLAAVQRVIRIAGGGVPVP